ncbi:hypothetical protein HPB47_022114 [Ixodes persulcatus]|uniref:Uncharacterized protein n=1 Tax=Ixodes persulcatus TaxID=34615 RepID=A0AC60QCG3_IXOPE|nr:hypothetical protein HPB47_022114 [Ixodes persulcatus]
MNPITFLSQIQQMGDPRTRDYPLVVNPFFVFPMILGYVYFVKVAGPRWMKDREPFEIINIVRLYNVCMVTVNARFLYVLLKMTYLPGGRYSLWCQGISGYMDEELTQYYKNGWFFVAVRYVDFLDTIFFVLRKKFRHITHLHVIHHTLVAANVWFFTLFAPEGHVAFGLALNVFVHIIMYSYYFLATLGPGVQKYLWWKKYLTTLQITQFVLSILHLSIPVFVDCEVRARHHHLFLRRFPTHYYLRISHPPQEELGHTYQEIARIAALQGSQADKLLEGGYPGKFLVGVAECLLRRVRNPEVVMGRKSKQIPVVVPHHP